MGNSISIIEQEIPDTGGGDISSIFLNVENCIKDRLVDYQSGNITKEELYGFIKNKLPIKSITLVPLIVDMILYRYETRDIRLQNSALISEVKRLTNLIGSIKQDIDVMYTSRCIFEISTDGTILEANDLTLASSGFSQDELIGQNMSIMNSGTHSKKFWTDFWITISSGREWSGDICNQKKDGTLVWFWTNVIPKKDIDNNITHYVIVREDISESYLLKKSLHEALDLKIDPLTGLPNNRKCLEDCAIDKNRSIALLHVNDMFDMITVFAKKTVDIVIKEIVEVLKTFCVGENTRLYKFEGHYFGIIFEEKTKKEYLQEKFYELTQFNFHNEGRHIPISFSLGIVLEEPNIDILLRGAYSAIKNSKKTRKPIFYNKAIHGIQESVDSVEMLNAVNEAFRNDLFTVYYQEIMENPDSIRKSKKRKFECLVRMYDSKEKKNLISPGKFRPIVIRSGKNQQLTDVVIAKVSAYMQDNVMDIFSINITEDDLNEENSAEHIYAIVSKYNIDPKRIIFEILEDIEDMGSGNIIENIKKLKSYGFQIAIDDFGTGYSNFSRIFELAPDYLKIDMKFIRGIDTNILNRKLVKYIVGFSHETGISVVAEGVETANEQLVIESLGVDFSQGYHFSEPIPVIV